MKTNTAIVGGNVTGNIGSCSVVSTDINTSFMYQKTVAVNSCTGVIVSESPEYMGVGAGLSMVFTGILFFMMCMAWILN